MNSLKKFTESKLFKIVAKKNKEEADKILALVEKLDNLKKK